MFSSFQHVLRHLQVLWDCGITWVGRFGHIRVTSVGFGLQKIRKLLSGVFPDTLDALGRFFRRRNRVWLRIRGKFRLEGTLGSFYSNLLLKPPMRSDQAALSSLWFAPENIQGWRHRNLPGTPNLKDIPGICSSPSACPQPSIPAVWPPPPGANQPHTHLFFFPVLLHLLISRSNFPPLPSRFLRSSNPSLHCASPFQKPLSTLPEDTLLKS